MQFFSHLRMLDDGHHFLEKIVLWRRRQWQRRVEGPHSVRRRHCDSQNLLGTRVVFSHCRNPSKLRVSRALWVRGDDGSGEMQM